MPRTKARPERPPRAGSAAQVTAGPGAVLTLAEAAAYLRVAEPDVLRLIREQGLPARQVGDDWRMLRAAVDGWLSTPATADRDRFWQTHFGALQDDPYLADIVREAYRKRGRPADGEL